jgi:hypothetical protein
MHTLLASVPKQSHQTTCIAYIQEHGSQHNLFLVMSDINSSEHLGVQQPIPALHCSGSTQKPDTHSASNTIQKELNSTAGLSTPHRNELERLLATHITCPNTPESKHQMALNHRCQPGIAAGGSSGLSTGLGQQPHNIHIKYSFCFLLLSRRFCQSLQLLSSLGHAVQPPEPTAAPKHPHHLVKHHMPTQHTTVLHSILAHWCHSSLWRAGRVARRRAPLLLLLLHGRCWPCCAHRRHTSRTNSSRSTEHAGLRRVGSHLDALRSCSCDWVGCGCEVLLHLLVRCLVGFACSCQAQ